MRIRSNILAGVAAITFCTPVLGQTTPTPAEPADTADASSWQIEEIVVTAEKRSRNIQQVPIAITALTGAELEKSRILNVSDVATRTPNFFLNQARPSGPTLNIRGVGSDVQGATFDPSVTVYVDEVFMGRAAGSVFHLFDLERVEVLRGPQGTLFGRNSVGGAVSLITRKPSAERYVKVEASLGNLGLLEAKGVLNAPLTDNLFGKISFSTQDRDGAGHNLTTGKRIGDTNSRNIRGQLEYEPSETLNILLTGDYSRDQIDGVARRPLNGLGVFATVGFDPASGFRDFRSPINGFFDRKLFGFSGRIDWETPIGNLTSISSWRRMKYTSDIDNAGAPGEPGFIGVPTKADTRPGFISENYRNERETSLSQELRLSSAGSGAGGTKAGDIDWTIGAFFLRDDTHLAAGVRQYQRLVSGALTSRDYIVFDDSLTTSYALFGQATYSPVNQVEITVGSRQTWDKKKRGAAVTDLDPARLYTNASPPGGAFARIDGEKTFSAFTPKATISYFPTLGLFRERDAMIYASFSKGFKSGAFGPADSPLAAVIPVEKEEATNYEVGFRTRFWNGRAQLNGTAFWLDFRNLQLVQRVLAIPGDSLSSRLTYVNARKARIKGLEFDAILRPFSGGALAGLTLSGNIGIQDSALTDPRLSSPVPIVDPDGIRTLVGQSLPNAPDLNYFISADYEVPVGSGSLTFSASDRYTGHVFFGLGETKPGGFQAGYHLTNASISFVPDNDSGWKFMIWSKNIFDKKFFVDNTALNGGVTGVVSVGDPRTFGVTISWIPRL